MSAGIITLLCEDLVNDFVMTCNTFFINSFLYIGKRLNFCRQTSSIMLFKEFFFMIDLDKYIKKDVPNCTSFNSLIPNTTMFTFAI